MSTGTRLFLAIVVPIVVVMAGFAALDQRQRRALLRDELSREGRAITLTLQMSVEDALRDRQLGDLREIIDRITGYERVFGARILDRDARVIYESEPLRRYPFQALDAFAAALRDGGPVETRRKLGEDPVIGFLARLHGPRGEVLGAIQVVQLESFIEEQARASRNSIVLFTLVMVLATGAIVMLVTRRHVVRPIAELLDAFRQVGEGRLSARAALRHGGEFGRVALEFNLMVARLGDAQRRVLEEERQRGEMEAGLRHAEHLASVGRLAAGLAHEIGTPLNVIAGRTDALLRHAAGTEAERNLRIIAAQIERITRIVRDMLGFGRRQEARKTNLAVRTVVARVLDLLEHRFRTSGIAVEVEVEAGAEELAVVADADQLQQVFLNVALNAADAMPGGGRLEIRAVRVRRPDPPPHGPERPFAAITFADTGGGIHEEHLARVFEPFFTTKDVGQGTGLGLSVSYGIVREHGGAIEVDSAPGRGTTVTVLLPLDAAPAGGARETARGTAA